MACRPLRQFHTPCKCSDDSVRKLLALLSALARDLRNFPSATFPEISTLLRAAASHPSRDTPLPCHLRRASVRSHSGRISALPWLVRKGQFITRPANWHAKLSLFSII